MPSKAVSGDDDAGRLHVLYGSPANGVSGADDQVFSQDTAWIDDDAEVLDRLGQVLR